MVNSVSDENFEADVINSDVPVLVDFWAEWCGPCKQLAPVLDQLAEEYNGKVKIVKINIEENPESPTKYEIRSIPTLMIFKNGELIDTKAGALPKAALKDWIENSVA